VSQGKKDCRAEPGVGWARDPEELRKEEVCLHSKQLVLFLNPTGHYRKEETEGGRPGHN
jgi:hypothetical protein